MHTYKCDPMNCSLPGPSDHEDFPGKNTGVGCHFLLQGIFPTQRSNPGLPHGRQLLCPLSHQGTPTQRTELTNNRNDILKLLFQMFISIS